MSEPVLDLSYLYEVSGGDPGYIVEVISLFLDTVPERFAELDQAIRETADFDFIRKQAHFLKSSSNIIKIGNIHTCVARIEVLAKDKTGQEEMAALSSAVLVEFGQALPLLKEEIRLNQEKMQTF